MVTPFNADYEQDGEPKKQKPWVIALLEALEAESLDNIRYYQSEIGYFGKIKEKTKNPIVAAHIDIDMHMMRYAIEENHDDIERFRREKKEFS